MDRRQRTEGIEAERFQILARPDQAAEGRNRGCRQGLAEEESRSRLACLHWPKEYGGRGATPIEKVIWQQEEGVYGKLTQPFQIGEGMCGPDRDGLWQ